MINNKIMEQIGHNIHSIVNDKSIAQDVYSNITSALMGCKNHIWKYKIIYLLLILFKYFILVLFGIIIIVFKYCYNYEPYLTLLPYMSIGTTIIEIIFRILIKLSKIEELIQISNQIFFKLHMELFRFLNYKIEYIQCQTITDAIKIFNNNINKIINFSKITSISYDTIYTDETNMWKNNIKYKKIFNRYENRIQI